jgi:hypothetical protein
MSVPCFGLDCSLAQASAKVACNYGANCYRKNPVRSHQHAHARPSRWEFDWNSSIARPCVAGSSRAVLAPAPGLKASLQIDRPRAETAHGVQNMHSKKARLVPQCGSKLGSVPACQCEIPLGLSRVGPVSVCPNHDGGRPSAVWGVISTTVPSSSVVPLSLRASGSLTLPLPVAAVSR